MSKDNHDPSRGPSDPDETDLNLDEKTAEIEEGTESVRRTIVGGRPIDRRRRKVRIPIGIEKVLCAAAGDLEFREQLILARADALTGTAFEVSDAESLILGSVSEDALRTMIDNIDLKRHRKRRFFRGIAAASLAATTATACIGENETAVAGGAAPDWPDGVGGDAMTEVVPGVDQIKQDFVPTIDTGSRPAEDTMDADVVEGHDGFAPGGVMPDQVGNPDVIDSEIAMDGGMWGDDVKEEK